MIVERPARQPQALRTRPPEREVDKARVTGFTDNVVSIALTLLVLDLRVPANLQTLSFHSLATLLGPRLASFLLSFAIVGVYWVGHHVMFTGIQRVSQRTLWINNFFLLGVSLLPASAALLGGFPGQRVSVVVYGANVLMVSLGNLLLLREAIRYHRLHELPYNHAFARTGMARLSVAAGIGLLGMALAWVDPWVSYAIYWIAPAWFAVMQFAH